MKVAFCGAWHVHAPDYARHAAELGEIVGIYEPNEQLRAAFLQRFPVPVFSSLDEFLASDAEGVIVCSATCDHADQMIRIARAGKHIFTEKVLALSDEDCARVAEAVRESGVRFVISLFQKTIAPVLTLKQVVDGGELGRLNYARFRNCHSGSVGDWLPAHFYNERECGGGAMIDLGAHGMYLLHWLLGEPRAARSVFTTCCERESVKAKNVDGVEDNAVSVMRFADGVIGINETGFVSAVSPVVLEVYGEQGYVRMEGSTVQKCSAATERRLLDVPLVDARPLPIVAFLTGADTTGLGIDEACSLTHMMVLAYAGRA